MAVSYIITVLDDDHLEVIKEEEIDARFPDSTLPMTIMEAINTVLDQRSAEEAENDRS